MIYILISFIIVILSFKKWYLLFLLLGEIIFIFFNNKKYFVYFFLGIFLGGISLINFPYQDNLNEFQGMVYERKDNYFLINVKGKNYYVYDKNHEYEQFDILLIDGYSKDICFSTLEGDFDFNLYLYNKKVEKEIVYTKIKFKYRHFFRKNAYINKFLSKYNAETQDFLSLFLFNKYNNDLSNDLMNLSLINFFSFSGLIIYFLYAILKKLFLYLFKDQKEILAKIFLFPFLVFSSYKLSFLKNYLNLSLKKNVNQSILMIILFFNYRFIYSSSFIYIFLIPFIFKYLIKDIKNQFQKSLIFLLLINIFFIFLEGKVNLINFLLCPFLSYVSKIIVILLLLFISQTPVINFLSKSIYFIVNVLNKMPVLYLEEKNYFLCIILFFVLLLMVFFEKLKLKRLNMIMTFLYFLSICVPCLNIINYSYVVFINVGQGDCILIHHQKTNILIDTGGINNKDIACDNLIPYFYKHHIYSLDNVFISHTDYDHSGALTSLMNNFKIDNVIYGSTFDEYKINGLIFKNLNNYQIGYEENENSSVIYFSFFNTNFLFMGDAPTSIEKKIMNDYPSLDIDILKVGHHGSKTSSSYEFLKYINPQEAIISVGKNNHYHHPDKIVLTYLNDLNIKIRRTDKEGSIIYKF